MRLFIAVWPPDDVLDAVAALDRPDIQGVRWTDRQQWHVTLRFLGNAELDDVVTALEGAPLPPARDVTAGPATASFGGRVLVVPVDGLDDVAAAVVSATAELGSRPPETRPFSGHLTLARSGSRNTRGPDLRRLAGVPVSFAWRAAEVTVVESTLRRTGAEYAIRARVPLL